MPFIYTHVFSRRLIFLIQTHNFRPNHRHIFSIFQIFFQDGKFKYFWQLNIRITKKKIFGSKNIFSYFRSQVVCKCKSTIVFIRYIYNRYAISIKPPNMFEFHVM